MDKDQLVKTLEADADFMQKYPNARLMLPETCEGVLAALAPKLGQPVTGSSFLEARLSVVAHAMRSGLSAKIRRAVWGEDDRRGAAEIDEDVEGVEGVAALFAPGGLDASSAGEQDRAVLESEGLSSENLEAYDAGTLTIGRLLETQPAFFIAEVLEI